MAKSYHNAPPNPDFQSRGAPIEEIRREFARRLQAARRSKGWNQSELARRVKTGRDNISNYERGSNMPRPEMLTKLAEALGVETGWLLPLAAMPSVDQEAPALSVQAVTQDIVWLRVNQQVPWEIAVQIMQLLKKGAGDDA